MAKFLLESGSTLRIVEGDTPFDVAPLAPAGSWTVYALSDPAAQALIIAGGTLVDLTTANGNALEIGADTPAGFYLGQADIGGLTIDAGNTGGAFEEATQGLQRASGFTDPFSGAYVMTVSDADSNTATWEVNTVDASAHADSFTGLEAISTRMAGAMTEILLGNGFNVSATGQLFIEVGQSGLTARATTRLGNLVANENRLVGSRALMYARTGEFAGKIVNARTEIHSRSKTDGASSPDINLALLHMVQNPTLIPIIMNATSGATGFNLWGVGESYHEANIAEANGVIAALGLTRPPIFITQHGRASANETLANAVPDEFEPALLAHLNDMRARITNAGNSPIIAMGLTVPRTVQTVGQKIEDITASLPVKIPYSAYVPLTPDPGLNAGPNTLAREDDRHLDMDGQDHLATLLLSAIGTAQANSPRPPDAPTVELFSGNAQITCTVTEPFNGHEAIDRYVIERSLTGTSGWVQVASQVDLTFVDGEADFVDTGLSNGTTYHYRARAGNPTHGFGDNSVAVSIGAGALYYAGATRHWEFQGGDGTAVDNSGMLAAYNANGISLLGGEDNGLNLGIDEGLTMTICCVVDPIGTASQRSRIIGNTVISPVAGFGVYATNNEFRFQIELDNGIGNPVAETDVPSTPDVPAGPVFVLVSAAADGRYTLFVGDQGGSWSRTEADEAGTGSRTITGISAEPHISLGGNSTGGGSNNDLEGHTASIYDGTFMSAAEAQALYSATRTALAAWATPVSVA